MANANQMLAWLALSAVAVGAPIAVAAPEKPAPAPAKQAAKAPDAQGNPDSKGNEGAAGAKKKDPAAAERSYAAGVKAFEAGKMTEAIQSLSAALANGGLPAPQMAKALYYRGAAYRKQEKPAQAISDLTTAVWLKGGLSDADRAQAIEQRQMAYREAGLGDTAPPIGSTPLDAPASPAGTPAAKPGTTVATAPPSFWSNIFPWASSSQSSAQQAPAATPEAAPAPAPAAETLAWQTTQQQTPESQPAAPQPAPVASFTAPEVPGQVSVSPAFTETSSTAPVPTAPAPALAPAVEPAAAPAASAPASQSSGPFSGVDKAVSGFFNNMFSSGQSATPPATPSSPVATSAITTATSSSPPQWHDATIVASAEPANAPADASPLPWSTQSSVPASAPVAPPPVIVAKAPAAPPPVVQPPVIVAKTPAAPPPIAPPVAVEPPPPPTIAVAPAAPPPVPVTASAPAGKYRLQVAAVRSRDEAERLASSVMKHQALASGAVRPEIDEAVLGSMGTFYRVRLGPYADAAEPGQLCKTLRPQGFDCLVVTQ